PGVIEPASLSFIGLPAQHKHVAPNRDEDSEDDYDPERISLDDLIRLQEAGEPVVILDARSERTYDDSDLQARGAVRIHPDSAVRDAAMFNLPKNAWLVAFCA